MCEFIVIKIQILMKLIIKIKDWLIFIKCESIYNISVDFENMTKLLSKSLDLGSGNLV